MPFSVNPNKFVSPSVFLKFHEEKVEPFRKDTNLNFHNDSLRSVSLVHREQKCKCNGGFLTSWSTNTLSEYDLSQPWTVQNQLNITYSMCIHLCVTHYSIISMGIYCFNTHTWNPLWGESRKFHWWLMVFFLLMKNWIIIDVLMEKRVYRKPLLRKFWPK